MTTITEKLAEALRALADCREPFNPDKPDDWNPEAYRNARTTLAEYEDAGRPLEVGDRVTVLAGSPHNDGSKTGNGAIGTIIYAHSNGYFGVDIDGLAGPLLQDDGLGWTYSVKHLGRIA